MTKKNSVRTSKKIAKVASKALRDGRTSKKTKRLAGAVLSNRKRTSKK